MLLIESVKSLSIPELIMILCMKSKNKNKSKLKNAGTSFKF